MSSAIDMAYFAGLRDGMEINQRNVSALQTDFLSARQSAMILGVIAYVAIALLSYLTLRKGLS
jgi:hypothetical protein